jgi:hypothetical protein
MTLPKDEKATVLLFQPVLLLQLSIPPRGNLTIELCMIDTNNNHRRFFISTAIREIKITALHASMPCPNLVSNGWVNVALDLAELVQSTNQMTTNFKGITFYALSGITVSGTFRLRKMMTLKHLPIENSGEGVMTSIYRNDRIPSTLDFPLGVSHCTQVINMTSIANKAHPPQQAEELFSGGIASSMRLHTPPKRKTTPRSTEAKGSTESRGPKTAIMQPKKTQKTRKMTPEADPLTIIYTPRGEMEAKSRSISTAETKSEATTDNDFTSPQRIESRSKSDEHLPALRSRAVSTQSVSIGPSENHESMDTQTETNEIIKRMKESLILDVQGEPPAVSAQEERPGSVELTDIPRNEIHVPLNRSMIQDEIQQTPSNRCSPVTQLENEYQEFLKRSHLNDMKLKGELSYIPDEKESSEEIQEQIECVEETELLDSNQVKFVRFISSGDREPLKHMQSAEQKIISSDTGLKMEQKLKIGSSKKRFAPAAETHFLSTDSRLEPWNDTEVQIPMVRYVSEAERESIEVPFESDDEDQQVSEEHFFIYDELGSKKEYQIKS